MNEERRKTLFRAIQKLSIYHEIQNEMGRAVVAFNFKEADKLLSHFALERQDVSLEYADEGVFEGEESIRSIIEELIGGPKIPGEMLDMQLTTPMIEVADDLMTAKCVWWCPGAGAIPREGREPQAIWAWGQLAVDFICSEGQWKIWHLHYFRFIKCDYKKGWVEDTSMIHRPNVPMHKLSKPGTYHNPYSPYSVREGIPAMPMPYKSYKKEDRYWELERGKE